MGFKVRGTAVMDVVIEKKEFQLLLENHGESLEYYDVFQIISAKLLKSFGINKAAYPNARIDASTGNWMCRYGSSSDAHVIRAATQEEKEIWSLYEDFTHKVFLNKLNKT